MRLKFYFLFVLLFSSLSVFAAGLDDFPKESYHKLVSEDQLIGKTNFSWELLGGLYVFKENSTMKVTLFKKPEVLQTVAEVKTNPRLEIQSFSYKMQSSDSILEVNGTRVGQNMRLEKIQAGNRQIKNIVIQEPLLMSPIIRPFLASRGFSNSPKETSFTTSLLEPSALTTIPMFLKVSPVSSKSNSEWSLSVTYLSHELKSRIKANGALISETTDIAGLPIEAVPVSKEGFSKIQLVGTKKDLVEQAKVSFPKLANSRTIPELSVRISGIELHNFQLNRHRQTLEQDVLTVKREPLPKESLPVQSIVGQKSLKKYLEGDISVPVFDPSIQRKARELVGTENNLWKRALIIHEFVNKHLKKDPFVSLPDALEALQSGKGDCNEHAVLFTALARAAGVPTRTVVGLVYSDAFYGGGEPGFYYHAWVEVFTGKDWVSMDPTWNQVPADSTHIAFVEGGADQQIQIASLMGKIRLQTAKAKSSVN